MRWSRPIALLLLTLVAGACESAPTTPALEAEGPDVSFATALTADQKPVPMLARLFEQAIARVRAEKGKATATQATAEYRRLLQAARSAHSAGDSETARKRMQEAQVVAARVVARVFPHAAEPVLGLVAEHLAALHRRIDAAEASGAGVARAREAAQRISRLHSAATVELQDGRRVPALVHATMAADLLAGLLHR